ncbi:MAG: proline--tRNA ligase [Candidatus Coatesbacteria bacterium]
MRLSRLVFQTLREAPKEADTVSHKLMVRASLIRQVAAGVYEWLPFGWRAVLKAAAIVREEMDRAGAQEVLLPQLSPRELWEESGRWGAYGKNLMRLKDRHERDFALGPTHEEVITDLARATLRSYRRLPATMYQIQTKFRDEMRPRFGVMRAREFMMKDAYSFDVDDAASERSYETMRVAYNRIFTRLGLNYRMVDADSGPIGGSFSQEFMVLADAGEDIIASCTSCDYAANMEKAESAPLPAPEGSAEAAPEAISTPGTKSANAVSKLLGRPIRDIAKLMFYQVGEELVGVMVRGDHEINEVRLARLLGVDEVVMAKADTIIAKTGLPIGYMGPVDLPGIRVIADRDLAAMPSIVTGANRVDEHLVHVKPGRDFTPALVSPIRKACEGDPCPKCGQPLKLMHGIEVGHIFKLGLKYSKAMHAVFLDEGGKEQMMVMGCYGIGVTRIVAAAVEQNHDDRGIIWPFSLAPYKAMVVPVGAEPDLVAAAEQLYVDLEAAGVEVLFDDRTEAPGVKFADADLLGVPVQLIVGKTFKARGLIEMRRRGTKQGIEVSPQDAVAQVKSLA